MTADDRTGQKRRAGERAAADVSAGSVVGLGTGTTAAHAIDALGRRVRDGEDLLGVPTSHQARRRAIEAGIPVRDLDQVDTVDVAIDGADAVVFGTDGDGDTDPAADGPDPDDSAGGPPTHSTVLVKGGGAAHAREKVVDAVAERLHVVVDPSKVAERLGRPVPVEVLPVAADTVVKWLRAHGGDPTVRTATEKDGPVVTDNGNWVLDCDFGVVETPRSLATRLSGLPGVVEHGLFVDMTDRVYVGTTDGVEIRTA